MRKVIVTFILLSMLTTGFLFAAGQKEASPNAPTSLIVSSRLYSPASEQKFLYDEIFPEFEKENNCVVKFEILDDTVLLKRAKLQSETGRVTTDVVIVHNGVMDQWIANKYVEELPVKDWPGRTFSKAFLDSIMSNGKTYFAPVGGDVYLLLANKKALKYLPAGVDVQNITWEQYVDWAVAIANGEGEGKCAVTGVPMKSLVYMYGGMFLSYGGPFPVINSPGAKEGWKLLTKMHNAYTPTVMTYDNVTAPMKSGEAWLTVAHMARTGEAYRSNPSNYVIAPAPRGPKGIGSIAGVSGFGVPVGAEHRDLALKFIEYMTRPDIAVKVARGTGGFLPPIDEAIDVLGNSPVDEVIKKGVLVLQKGVVSGVPGSAYTSWGAVKQVYDDVFKEMIIGTGVYDETLIDNAQKKIDALKK
ncbi:MAG: sugar ABC transporter substrate-binding protein [Spirochaetes bacterium]|nr:MAG: sugar ABC transporter substrate-binding protein [Spirochaetota bacterium]